MTLDLSIFKKPVFVLLVVHLLASIVAVVLGNIDSSVPGVVVEKIFPAVSLAVIVVLVYIVATQE
tara:strand:- start:2007 stop:2201 length:195 start_codon:yes stop_codon:yes gene_type:complete